MNIKICICAPAHRPQNWMALYNSIGVNDVEFELVFVGPNPPDYKLPGNFSFIKTFVKPPQCMEIAVRNTDAELVMNIADDCEFVTPGALDKLYNLYKSCNCEKAIVSSRLMQDKVALPLSIHHFFSAYGSSQVLPLCGLMSRRLYRDLGGIDRNFEAIFWEIDLAMRVYALGGRVVMSDVYLNEDKTKCAQPEHDLWGQSGVRDRRLLESLWISEGKVGLSRQALVAPFLDKNILRASQGPRGRWRGNGIKLFEKIEDNLNSQWSVPGRIYRAIKRPRMYFNYTKRIASSVRKKFLLQK